MKTDELTPKTKTLRQQWMSTLATADFDQLTTLWQAQHYTPDYQLIRAPEIGLAQVQARMGGTGNRFNVADITVTRCVVKLASGDLGYSYLSGRNKPHAQLAAVIDGLMQSETYQQELMLSIIKPLQMSREKKHTQRQQQVASSKVDFFTLVRGDD
ncbi:phosphonate C-P lyase system protein PhnG [Vibrio rumoiensis]|uniref:Phosphonate C-P lyase system protein PhnG n=1 Tax=Vibrio rumoiensis 1S-45 TaxID=1188252 RepID=A0A1E5E5N5_9VIBR|nr:phosphonate C-P lyase system protein PhnG [Vibrio rumoiensis]OEF28979.1 phosphonate C-P lyase system protein PhnG [Vibrio rumoiensis 1S-45]